MLGRGIGAAVRAGIIGCGCRLQTWVRISETPLKSALATAIGQQSACAYGADLASAIVSRPRRAEFEVLRACCLDQFLGMFERFRSDFLPA